MQQSGRGRKKKKIIDQQATIWVSELRVLMLTEQLSLRKHISLFVVLQSEAQRRNNIPGGSTQQPHPVDRQPGCEERGPSGGDSPLPQKGIQLRSAKVSQ